jgi:hypothetical protein
VIERQYALLNDIVRRRGWDAARAEIVCQLTAAACWLDAVYGAHASYELFQDIAIS